MKVYITKYPEWDRWFTNLGNQLKRSKEKAQSRRKNGNLLTARAGATARSAMPGAQLASMAHPASAGATRTGRKAENEKPGRAVCPR